ncbi:uncharacterized protein VNE69_02189 [Vairimorpha necatrix]|uniref:Uncharacterized protein n=1 Tax=Vairimorpha necatrix TaxID=6039 RepID=A0AAX4J9Y1_9MICR
MLLVLLLFVSNIKILKANDEIDMKISTEERKERYNKCVELLSQKEAPILCVTHSKEKKEKIGKIMYDVLLDAIEFPLKMQPSWPKPIDENEYEIKREDVSLCFYQRALTGISDMMMRYGKSRALHIFVYELADKTRRLCQALICMYDFDDLDLDQVRQILKKYFDFKLSEENNLIVEQVCKNDNFKQILYDVFHSIGNQADSNAIEHDEREDIDDAGGKMQDNQNSMKLGEFQAMDNSNKESSDKE